MDSHTKSIKLSVLHLRKASLIHRMHEVWNLPQVRASSEGMTTTRGSYWT
jgi:hypothetical protein